MPSEFDILAAEFCSPTLVEQFGERDAQGDLAKCTAHPPGREDVEIIGPILGSIEILQLEDDRGNVAKRQTRILKFQKQAGLTVIELNTTFTIDGLKWAVQQSGSRDDGGWLTYQLERKPLQQLDPKRDARTI